MVKALVSGSKPPPVMLAMAGAKMIPRLATTMAKTRDTEIILDVNLSLAPGPSLRLTFCSCGIKVVAMASVIKALIRPVDDWATVQAAFSMPDPYW